MTWTNLADDEVVQYSDRFKSVCTNRIIIYVIKRVFQVSVDVWGDAIWYNERYGEGYEAFRGTNKS